MRQSFNDGRHWHYSLLALHPRRALTRNLPAAAGRCPLSAGRPNPKRVRPAEDQRYLLVAWRTPSVTGRPATTRDSPPDFIRNVAVPERDQRGGGATLGQCSSSSIRPGAALMLLQLASQRKIRVGLALLSKYQPPVVGSHAA